MLRRPLGAEIPKEIPRTRSQCGWSQMPELIKLSNLTISDLPSAVAAPTYDRLGLRPGIVHIGLGNFHRAHQSWYLHRLFEKGLNRDWAIIGAGVRAFDARQREKLLAQDCLTTLIELDPGGKSAEVVGSMIDYIPVQEGNGALIDRMARSDIRIVALTVTEGGYYTDATSDEFDAAHPDILHDAANPNAPTTAFGAIVAALKRRRDTGGGPFTCMSCDNLQGNGEALRRTVVSLARLSDPALSDWIDANCTFPNSMVDCIVPATGPKEIALAREFGVDDRAPVTHENFRQWVIEDDFCAGRPDWHETGATFSNRVPDYERMKIRILNAGHQVIANPGEILSIETISGCMEHQLIRALLRKVESEEIVPRVNPVPGMAPNDYFDLIEKRFSNPAIVDTTRRVAFDGSSRHPGFVLPMIREGLASDASVEGLALVEAIWARMCEGTREDASRIEDNDPSWRRLAAVAKRARDDPGAWLEQAAIYGDLANAVRFAGPFKHWLSTIWAEGLEAALSSYTGDRA